MEAEKQAKRPDLLALAIQKVHRETFGEEIQSEAHDRAQKPTPKEKMPTEAGKGDSEKG